MLSVSAEVSLVHANVACAGAARAVSVVQTVLSRRAVGPALTSTVDVALGGLPGALDSVRAAVDAAQGAVTDVEARWVHGLTCVGVARR